MSSKVPLCAPLPTAEEFAAPNTCVGVTATAGGFYGPQGRVLRIGLQDDELNSKIDSRYDKLYNTIQLNNKY